MCNKRCNVIIKYKIKKWILNIRYIEVKKYKIENVYYNLIEKIIGKNII